MSEQQIKRKGKGQQHRSYGMLGKHHSEESKRKMSEAMKGRKRSEETRKKISLGRLKMLADKKKGAN